jgi:hypothetical protein
MPSISVGSSSQDPSEDLPVEFGVGEEGEVERVQGSPSHGPYVGEGVRGRDGSEVFGAIDDGADHVRREHECSVWVVFQAHDGRVVGELGADEDVLVPYGAGGERPV